VARLVRVHCTRWLGLPVPTGAKQNTGQGEEMMNLKQLVGAYGVMAVIALVINGALLAGAVWLVVKVLKWTGVL